MSNNLCVACGAHSVREVLAPFTVEHHGQSTIIDDRRMECSSCGNVSYVGQQIPDHQFGVAAAIREIDGLLSAEQLSQIRSKYRLRQTDMEQMLSIGPKTWTRWERGKVPQSKSTDKLIRAMADDPLLAQSLMRDAGVVNHEASEVFEAFARKARFLAEKSWKADLQQRLQVGTEIDTFVERAFNTVDDARKKAAMEIEARAA